MCLEEALSFALRPNGRIRRPAFENRMYGGCLMTMSDNELFGLSGMTYRIGVLNLNFLLPADCVTSHPEHAPKHALQPILNIAGLDPTRLRKRPLLVKVHCKNGLQREGRFPERRNSLIIFWILGNRQNRV